LQLHGHKKHRFGSKSESCAQQVLESTLEELEIEKAAEAPDEETFFDAEDAKPLPTRRKRKMFPKPLKQVQKNFKRKRPVSPAYWLRFGAAVPTVENEHLGALYGGVSNGRLLLLCNTSKE
jgi:hypothetical protein